MPGKEGDIWLAGGTNGLFHSTNSGTSFTKVATTTEALNIAFGKAAPGQSTMALFLIGTVDGVKGVFRSDNAGGAWVRINDDQHQYGNIGEAITGDPRVFGRVYLGTNGRGILVADRTGPPPTTPPVSSSPASPPPTSSRPPSSPPPTSSRPPSSPPPTGGGCTATYSITNTWPGNFGANVVVTNTGTTATQSWTVRWTFANGQVINQLWGGRFTQSGASVTVINETYNNVLPPNGTTNFGFNASVPGATNAIPTLTCSRT
jgi:hypothetical protein